ncbi:MAG: TolC family protein [Candidatus Binatia bacterium]
MPKVGFQRCRASGRGRVESGCSRAATPVAPPLGRLGRAMVYGLCLWCAGVQAETVPGAAVEPPHAQAPLDCEAAVTFVLAEHPGIKAAQSGVLEARALADIMRWLARPELRVRTDASTRGDETRLGVRWPLAVPGVPGAKTAAAQSQVRWSSAEADALRAQVAAAVRLDYAAVRYARAQRGVLEQLAASARLHAQVVRQLTVAGTATALALESATLAAEEAREEAARARVHEELADRAVTRWTGQPAPAGSGPCASAPAFSVDAAVAARPDVRRAKAALAAADAEARATVRKRWLWPSFVQATLVHERGDDGVLLEAGVPLPLPNKQAIAAAARRQKLRFQLEAVERRARAEIEAAVAQVHAARARLTRWNAAAGTLARAQTVAVQAEQAGAAPDELWRLERHLTERQRHVNETRYELEKQEIKLRLRLGLP